MEIFTNAHKFYNKNINKLYLMPWKGFYPLEYIGTRERFDETSLPDKKEFHSSLKMENITNANYKNTKRTLIKEWLQNRNLGNYYGLYVQRDMLFLAVVFESFHNKRIEISDFDTTHFLSAPELAW